MGRRVAVTLTPAWTVTNVPLSCPDCGLPLLEVNYHDPDRGFRVTYPRCGCFGPVAPTADIAVLKWNRMGCHGGPHAGSKS